MRNKAYLPFLACFSAGIFSFYNLFQFSLFNIISPKLLIDFHLTNVQLGIFSSVYLLANTLWLIPGGMLINKYSARTMALVFVLLEIIASFFLAISACLWLSISMRFLQGLASAMSLLISIRLASSWFPKTPATAIGIVGGFALAGGIFGNMGFAKAVALWGWRNGLFCAGFLGLLFFIVIFLFLFEMEQNVAEVKSISIKDIKNVISNWRNICCGFYVGLMNLPVFTLATLWGTLYLTKNHQVSTTEASIICGLLFIGLIIGSPIIGFIYDKLDNRRQPMLISAILVFTFGSLIIAKTSLGFTLLAVIFFALGFFSGAQIVAYAAINKGNADGNVNLATGLISFLSNLIGFIAQPLFGFILNVRF